MANDIRQAMQKQILLFDGAMGTMLQKNGLVTGDIPEQMNLDHPDTLIQIHKEFIDAGADVITANTFQCNELKLLPEMDVATLVTAGIQLAQKAGARYVAVDVGPLGQIFEPIGVFTFQEAYDMFAVQMIAAEKAGADVILLETFSDLFEMKIAILAAKENTSLPIFATMTFQEDGYTFMGTSPEVFVHTVADLGIDALGVNCSLGPEELLPIVKKMLAISPLPVMVQANAGLPCMEHGATVYKVTADEFAQSMRELIESGVSVIGGCCGTTPEFIQKLDSLRKEIPLNRPKVERVTAITSGTQVTVFDKNVTVIGERINPTGKKKLKEALTNQKMDYVLGEAIDQEEAGSDVLDVNVGVPGLDEPSLLPFVVREIQAITRLPLQIDSSNPQAIENAVRIYNGKPIINSVNGEVESMEKIFPIVKKYGAAVVCLTLDEDGIPLTADGRVAVAKKIVKSAESYGIPKENLIFDCLALTVSAQQDQALETLQAISYLRNEMHLKTVLGVSNISFGLPNRPLINATFLAAAFGAGLDSAILNPLSSAYMQTVHAFRVLNQQDVNSEYFVEHYNNLQTDTAVVASDNNEADIVSLILKGRKELIADKVTQLLNDNVPPLDIINEQFTVALNIVGEKFSKQELFLPQLMQSAETVQAGFVALKSFVEAEGEKTISKGTIIIATVKGDIHDIGKNIVAMLLENYGFNVIDLGKDIPGEVIIDAVHKHDAKLVGLSALMTTTVANMQEIITQLRDVNINIPVMVGGAVLTQEYADMVGADYYAKDALESVEIANQVFHC